LRTYQAEVDKLNGQIDDMVMRLEIAVHANIEVTKELTQARLELAQLRKESDENRMEHSQRAREHERA
jgi:predicted outer membrane protein